MDILYIVGTGSNSDNFELRCSLRSIDKYGKNVGKVVVSGYCPDWLSDKVIKVPCNDVYTGPNITQAQKASNITHKLLEGVDKSDIGDKFLVSMDDHFYIKETDFDTYPFFVRKSVNGIYLPTHSMADTEYRDFLADCCDFLIEHGLPTLHFGLHRNRLTYKEDIEECRDVLEDAIKYAKPCGSLIYLANYHYSKHPFDYKKVRDVKLCNGYVDRFKVNSKKTEVFSTNNFEKDSPLYTLMSSLYSRKSKYEN